MENREIKFKGKRVDTKEWVCGSHVKCNLSEHDYIITEFDEVEFDNQPNTCIAYQVIPETVGQFTGLKDKNGKEGYRLEYLSGIFEGGYIDYCNKCKQFQCFHKGVGCMACEGEIDWYEVVEAIEDGTAWFSGNFFDNPELMGGK